MSRQFDQRYSWAPDGTHMDDSFEFDDVRYKRIPGWRHYFVSEDGRILSLLKEEGRFLKTWKNQYGHLYTRLHDGDQIETISVHRAVAEAFVPNPHGYSVVRHLDDDPNNNEYTNLAWGTHADNRRDCVEHDRDFRKGVYCFEDDGHFRSCADAADYYGVSRASITHACQGKATTIHGKHFCYEKDIQEKANDRKWLSKYGNYKPLKAINIKTGAIMYFGSRKEASRELKVHDSGISNVLAGRLRQTGGWRFEEGD